MIRSPHHPPSLPSHHPHLLGSLLAPMAGITNSPYRRILRRYGAGLLTTELVSARGLDHRSSRTLELLAYQPDEHPIGAQLFGDDSSSLVAAGLLAQDLGFDFIEINCGCPVPKVVRGGGGSALLRHPNLSPLRSLLEALQQNLTLPLSLKIRTGWDENHRNADQVILLAQELGIAWVTVHGRTRAQGYSGKADWDYIQSLVTTSALTSSSFPIVGNGDILTAEELTARRIQSGCQAVMVGRGVLKNPWVFQETSTNPYFKALNTPHPPHQRFQIFIQEYFEELTNPVHHYSSDALRLNQFKRVASCLSASLPQSSQFRRKIYDSSLGLPEALHQSLEFFSKFSSLEESHSDPEEITR